MDEETKAVETIKEVKSPPPKPKAKTPRPKPRGLEVLDTLDAKKMTDTEKNNYIAYCRSMLTRAENQNKHLDGNCRQAYEQYRNANTAYQELRAEYETKINYCKQLVSVCNKSISMLGGPHVEL